MAKSKGFFGLRSGSTKNFTFSELHGPQITKERVYKVKNPRTLQQMRQRMVMATVSAAYSYLKEICDHSFEGFGVGSPCMSEFMRVNLNALKASAQNDAAKIAFNAFQDKNINPVPFIVSQGSLNFYTPRINGREISIEIPRQGEDLSTAELIYEAMGIKAGDLITIIIATGEQKSDVEYFAWAPNPLTIIRFHADKSGPVSDLNDAFTIESKGAEGIDMHNILKENSIKIYADVENAGLCTVILSRKAADKWLRSNSVMVLDPNFTLPAVARQLATYPVERDLILNGSGLAKGNSTSSLPKPSLSLSTSSISITTPNGSTNPPTLIGRPDGATVTYEIANSNVASVDPSSGFITAKANGQTKVTIYVSATETTGAASIWFALYVSGQESDAETGGGEAESKPHN